MGQFLTKNELKPSQHNDENSSTKKPASDLNTSTIEKSPDDNDVDGNKIHGDVGEPPPSFDDAGDEDELGDYPVAYEVPIEIWVDIFKYVAPASLKTLNFVSSRFRDMLHEVLWAEPSLKVPLKLKSTKLLFKDLKLPITKLRWSQFKCRKPIDDNEEATERMAAFVEALLDIMNLGSFIVDAGGAFVSSSELRHLLTGLPVTEIYTNCFSLQSKPDEYISLLTELRPSAGLIIDPFFHSRLNIADWRHLACLHITEVNVSWNGYLARRFTDQEWHEYDKIISKLKPKQPIYSIIGSTDLDHLKLIRIDRFNMEEFSSFSDQNTSALLKNNQRPTLFYDGFPSRTFILSSFDNLRNMMNFPIERLETSWFPYLTRDDAWDEFIDIVTTECDANDNSLTSGKRSANTKLKQKRQTNKAESNSSRHPTIHNFVVSASDTGQMTEMRLERLRAAHLIDDE